mmetsp:Transcript_13491/g.13228  ORF Transcript_13491/g.13228 Transcript_13491/m.13228 type:complete len:95 (+) Transcript_13491:222-506(+)
MIMKKHGRYLVKYDNTEIWSKYESDNAWFTEDSRFYLRPGLGGGTSISFESVHLPGWYIWDDDTYSFMEELAAHPGMEAAASWHIRPTGEADYF